MIKKTIEISGKTEDEAIEVALEQLNLTRDDISVEIIERAKTGFLGIKNSPAIVKIQYEVSNETSDSVSDVVSNVEHAIAVKTFLKGLFVHMDISVDVKISEADDAINVVLTGKEPGALIGRRGETLDAIQHLTNYVVNKGSSSRIRINMDAENYRQRRSDTLESLATRTAEKAIRYRKNMTLDPMNAYERHIIHSTLQDNDKISTFSVGSEPNRRVVIAFGSNNSIRRSPSESRRKPYNTNRSYNTTNNDVSQAVTPSPSNTEATTYREWS